MINRLLGLLSMLVVILTACNTAPVELPLAEDRPTFLFFYTDG